MATVNKKLTKMIVDRIDIVGHPANGERRFTMIKSEDVSAEVDPTAENHLQVRLQKFLGEDRRTDEETLVFLKKQPELANTTNTDPPPPVEDLGRTEAIEHMNALVRQASDLPLPLRKHLAEVCNYMGLSGPDTTTPDVPDYDPIMSQLKTLTGVMEKAITAWTTPPAQPAAAPLKKEEPPAEVVPVPEELPVALVKQIQQGQADTRTALEQALKRMEALQQQFLIVAGKDPGSQNS